jgi:hypothetical protein
MKLQLPIFLCIFLIACMHHSYAQDFSNPGDYMTAVSTAQVEMDQKYMAYMSAASHGRRARKVDKMRQAALESIDNCRYKTIDLPLYKGDNSLRQSSMDYIKLCYNVFNEDYAKIVNMQEIAEQSYDEMEALILLQEKTDEKIDEASSKMHTAETIFAAKYNVKLINTKDELGEKLDVASKLNVYKNNVYLLFFKCYWQDGEVVKAMNAGKVTEAEQGRNSLLKYASDGLTGLDTLKNFEGDPSLATTCKQVLQFYKGAAENDMPKLMDYFLKKENFEKVKKSFDAKSESDRTKKDVDSYNAGVKDFNTATSTFNSVNDKLNNGRNDAIKKWDEAEKSFADGHMPYYK